MLVKFSLYCHLLELSDIKRYLGQDSVDMAPFLKCSANLHKYFTILRFPGSSKVLMYLSYGLLHVRYHIACEG